MKLSDFSVSRSIVLGINLVGISIKSANRNEKFVEKGKVSLRKSD